jgi:hypothetical protein
VVDAAFTGAKVFARFIIDWRYNANVSSVVGSVTLGTSSASHEAANMFHWLVYVLHDDPATRDITAY